MRRYADQPDADLTGETLLLINRPALIFARIASEHEDSIITPPEAGRFVFLKV